MQKSVPVKLARLLPYIAIGCCFDSHPRIDSALQKPAGRQGLVESAISIPGKQSQRRIMLHQHVQAKTPLKLKGVVQRYAWGKIGGSSRIAAFVEGAAAGGPLAEFWLGAHPKGAAEVILGAGKSVSLSSLLVGNNALPFMLKVLSINPEFGLSIQSHPDAKTAQALHAKDPEHYPDPFHKPELGIALSPVSLLYGFKSCQQIVRQLELLPELRSVVGKELASKLDKIPPGQEQRVLKEVFTALISTSADETARFVSAVLKRFEGKTNQPVEFSIVRRLVARHGQGDSGLAALWIMNVVTIAPGQAIFIGPNIPHAYLDGDLVECMACSDNVIRAGLTTKYKDRETLLETLSYSTAGPLLVAPERASSGILAYKTPAREFSIGVVPRGRSVHVDAVQGPGIVLCLGSAATVRHAESGKALSLSDGGAALLLKGSGQYELDPADADLFVAMGGVEAQ
jgi:mannose-6-phosphate isomerase